MTSRSGDQSVRALQREILIYLLQHGPKSWDAHSSHFSRAASLYIAPALDELKMRGHIVFTRGELVGGLDKVTIVAITKSGINMI